MNFCKSNWLENFAALRTFEINKCLKRIHTIKKSISKFVRKNEILTLQLQINEIYKSSTNTPPKLSMNQQIPWLRKISDQLKKVWKDNSRNRDENSRNF